MTEKTEKKLFPPEEKSQIQLSGNRRLTAEGCLGVEEYRTETVKLKFEGFCLRVFGQDLTLGNLRGDSLTINGRITGMEFDGACGK